VIPGPEASGSTERSAVAFAGRDRHGSAMLDRLARLDEGMIRLARRVALVGVAGMLLIALGTITDVLARWLFGEPLTGFNEVVQLCIAVAIAATFPAGAAQRVNLTIDLFVESYSRAANEWLKCLGSLLLLLYYLFLSWQIGAHAADLQARQAVTVFLEWPRAPFMWAVAVLLAVTALAQLAVFLASLRDALLVSRDGGARATPRTGDTRPLRNATYAAWALGLLLLLAALVFAAEQGIGAFGALAQNFPSTVAIALFFVMWVLSVLLVPLAAAMALTGLVGAALLTGLGPALNIVGTEAAGFITKEELAVLPLFLLMGSFAAAANLSTDVYNLAHALLGHRRGGLALATIGGCAGFGALTGSSLATAATIGQAALPEMRRRGYAPGLATGCVAAGGTLGQLVPPSTVIILYAILTEESIGRLFIAAIIPAAIATLLYLVTIALFVRASPGSAPPAQPRPPVAEMLRTAGRAWGVVFMFALVIGGLYGGLFTATEAAAVGAFTAFLFALFRGRLTGGELWRVMGEVTRTTAMIYLLIFGAVTFSFFMGITGLPELLGKLTTSFALEPLGVIAILLVIYILLGAVMDPFPVMVITIPIVTPMVASLGYDLIWWGIIMVCVVETGLITPPFGINVFILKGISGGDVPMWTVFRGVMPFVLADFVRLAILVLFPVLVLWLPSTMVS
jgi:C4-dicarboxylate transporter, DctM subunit